MSMVILGRYSLYDQGDYKQYVQRADACDDAFGDRRSVLRPQKTRQKLQGAELGETENDFRTLDMKKAIADMKRDRILEDYLYFIGNQKHLA